MEKSFIHKAMHHVWLNEMQPVYLMYLTVIQKPIKVTFVDNVNGPLLTIVHVGNRRILLHQINVEMYTALL